MLARLHSWWQQIKQHRVAIGVTAIILLVSIALIIAGYSIEGTGFNGFTIITTSKTTSGASPPTITRTIESQPGKTLWDWLQLLIIPAVLAVGGYVINLTISRGEQEATKQRAKTEQGIAQDNQRETALQEYIDKMSELIIEKKLRDSKPEDEIRTIARVRTLTVLPRLDPIRKRSVLQFLYESGLIDKDKRIIDLSGAALNHVKLSGAALWQANMSGSDLRNANLNKADLNKANMSGADLSRADLVGADLISANLSKAILIGIWLNGVDLSNAILGEADLSGANLSGANLRRVNLSGVNLSGAKLRGANLSDANLRETKLSNADLSGADLSRAVVLGKELNKAQSLQGATMPDGSKHP